MSKNGFNQSDKTAVVVIGAGFGDEGKGLLTDFYAANYGKDCIVARFNGGAQAGHTVVTPDERRHIHSHFGSGTLFGAATFLSRYFVSNPMLFRRESADLENLGTSSPTVFADERGLVTTPFDMLVNQWAENARGKSKHGSCGVGFGETIERNLYEEFAISIADLADEVRLRVTLDEIRQKWIPARLRQLNIPKLSPAQKVLLASERLREDFIEAASAFYDRLQIAGPEILNAKSGVVFEGAQGLLLDEDYGWFPHVTRSSTGLKNVVELAMEAGIKRLDCVYATRAYTTRHGAGPLPHELLTKPYPDIEDSTNLPNPHQDKLRFGWLDLDLLNSTISADFERYGNTKNLAISKRLAITCLDQINGRAVFIQNGVQNETTVDDFINSAAQTVNAAEVYTSYGQTRETMFSRKSGRRIGCERELVKAVFKTTF